MEERGKKQVGIECTFTKSCSSNWTSNDMLRFIESSLDIPTSSVNVSKPVESYTMCQNQWRVA